MDYTILFGGAGAIVLGGLITVLLTYGFQKKLLNQQLEAQEKSHKELLLFLDKVSTVFDAQLRKIGEMLEKIKLEIHG